MVEKTMKRSRRDEYMEELYKKDLNELHYYDDVVSHPEPDNLEYEVKGALLLVMLGDMMKFQQNYSNP